MTTLEILEAARDQIRNPKNWCQGRCRWPEKDARCAAGAIWDVDDENGTLVCKNTFAACEPALAALAKAMKTPQSLAAKPQHSHGVPEYNDTHTHAEVLEAFNLAIQAELAKEEAHSRHMREEQEREQAEDPAAPLVFAGEPVLSGAC